MFEPKVFQKMKQLIKKIPVLGPILRFCYRKWICPPKPFTDSKNYWIDRYESGGNSGVGSYNQLAEFKAGIINEFIEKNKVKSVIEFGCGDGNQLRMAKYPRYAGYDISQKAIDICCELFKNDASKSFSILDKYKGETADLALSLDVIYHLIEDEIFSNYMHLLFDSAEKFVIVYSSDTDLNENNQATHVKHRCFTRWVINNKPDWQLMQKVPNQYPLSRENNEGSFADFFIFEKIAG